MSTTSDSPSGRSTQTSKEAPNMELPETAVLLRIFLDENRHWHHLPLYEAIVMKAREAHLAGATVLRGPLGYGKSNRIHTAKILRLSMDLPIVVEIVDAEEKINAFLPVVDEMADSGLATLEKVTVIHYRHKEPERKNEPEQTEPPK